MSRCISRAGEYGDHVLADTGTAVERFVCSRCFVVAEDELFAEVDIPYVPSLLLSGRR